MKIGIDLSSLQGAHRMRGIGYTLINVINELPTEVKLKHSFVFYLYPIEQSKFGDPLDLLDLDGVVFETRELRPSKQVEQPTSGKLRNFVRLHKLFSGISDFYAGDSRIVDASGLDIFLQTDQSQPLPRVKNLKTALMLYDLIPYVLEWDYLWTYRTARLNNFSRKAALRVHVRRWSHALKLKINMKRADMLLAISETTKKDFVIKLGGNPKKIRVALLGINIPKGADKDISEFYRYVPTSWQYIKRPVQKQNFKPYLLFVGGADERRKLQDLVTAFNQLKARGHDINLVLAGDSMQGPRNIATIKSQLALLNSSYINDIYFLGFIKDDQRDWLYRNATAFVFPSKYEGFGLPVLEAMSYGCPVISYDNTATREVAGGLPIYAQNYQGIIDAVIKLSKYNQADMEKLKSSLVDHTSQYRWSSASKNIFTNLEDLE